MCSNRRDYWTFSEVAANIKRARYSSCFVIVMLRFACALGQREVVPLRNYMFIPCCYYYGQFRCLPSIICLRLGLMHLNSFISMASYALKNELYSPVIFQLYEIVKITQDWVWGKLGKQEGPPAVYHLWCRLKKGWFFQNLAKKETGQEECRNNLYKGRLSKVNACACQYMCAALEEEE